MSPFLRRRRLARISALIKANDVVLDLACGNGFLREHLPQGCRYFGVDRIVSSMPGHFDSFAQIDISRPDAFDQIRQWLPDQPTVITLAAFLEHLKHPAGILKVCQRLCEKRTRIVGTTPHPRGRAIHDSLARLGICSRGGAEEHETFLDQSKLSKAGEEAGLTLVYYRQFLCGLNQLFVYEKRAGI